MLKIDIWAKLSFSERPVAMTARGPPTARTGELFRADEKMAGKTNKSNGAMVNYEWLMITNSPMLNNGD